MNEMTLEHFAQVVSLCQEGAILTYETHSQWLVEQRDEMMKWKSVGYQGLNLGSAQRLRLG
jgi:hypothetical protein